MLHNRIWKSLLLIMIALYSASCEKPPSDNSRKQSESSHSRGQAASSEIAKEDFPQFIRRMESAIKDFEKQIETLRTQMQSVAHTPAADSVFLEFRKTYLARMEKVNNELSDNAAVSTIQSLEDPKATVLQKSMNLLGYDLLFEMGEPLADESASYLLDTFGSLTTSAMMEFLTIRKEEQKEGFSSDASLVISWNALAERISVWDNFLSGHPEFAEKEDAEGFYKMYLSTFITGMDNSGTFTHTEILNPEIRKSYEDYIRKYPNTNTANILTKYLELLKKTAIKFRPASIGF